MENETNWSALAEKMPYRSKYSDPHRHRLDPSFVGGYVKQFTQANNGYVMTGYIREDYLRFNLGPLHICFPFKIRTLMFVCDSVYWSSNANLQSCLKILESVMKNGRVDRIHFHYFRPDRPIASTQLFEGLQLLGFRMIDIGSSQLYRCYIGKDSVNPSERLKAKNRYKERKKLRDLGSKFGETKFVCYKSVAQADDFFSAIRLMSDNTWQKQNGLGTVVDSDKFRRIFEIEARLQRLRCYILFVGNKPVAYQFGTVYGSVYHYEYIGYDSDFYKFSPGQLLRLYSFDEMHEEGIDWIDFGHVEFEFKKQWSTESIELPDRSFYNSSTKGFVAYLLEWTQSRLRALKRR